MEQNTYYFVGIKGTGMASLARILHDKGHQVLGSDIEKETFKISKNILDFYKKIWYINIQ